MSRYQGLVEEDADMATTPQVERVVRVLSEVARLKDSRPESWA
jgi:hypothetical protein